MQETLVQSLDWEDPTCCRAAKPVCWACALEPRSCSYWAHMPLAQDPQQEKPVQWEAHHDWRVAPAPCN